MNRLSIRQQGLIALLVCSITPSTAAAQLQWDPSVILGPMELPEAPTPVVDALPVTTPYRTLPVRGLVPAGAEGQISAFVFVHGAPRPVVTRTAQGNFCVEVEFDQPGTYTLELRSQDAHATVSRPARYTVIYDPSAPAIPGLRTCAGTVAAFESCTPSDEVCDNGDDDDCDGLFDARDPDCTPDCEEDRYERRDGSTPFLDYGVYPAMHLCSAQVADTDRFGLSTVAGHSVWIALQALDDGRVLDVTLEDESGRILRNATTEAASVGTQDSSIDGLVYFEVPASELGLRFGDAHVFVQVSERDGAQTQYVIGIGLEPEGVTEEPAMSMAANAMAAMSTPAMSTPAVPAALPAEMSHAQ